MINKTLATVILASAFASTQGFSVSGVISTGGQSSYALMSDGTVKSWGHNGVAGKLGCSNNLPLTAFSAPTNVVNLSDGSLLTNVVMVAGGREHCLALLSDSTIVGWGTNKYEEMALTTPLIDTGKSAAFPIRILTGVTYIDAGQGFSLAVVTNSGGARDVYGWGNNNHGQLGSAVTTAKTNLPHQVVGLSNIVKVAAGAWHCLALDTSGSVWAWGHGEYGKLGNGGTANVTNPVQITSLSNVIAIAASYEHSLAATSDGKVWAWGYGFNGQLGNGSTANSSIPVLVSEYFTNVIVSTTSWTSGTGVSSSGHCREDLTYITIQTNYCTNVVVEVAAGRNWSLARTYDGSVWAWGNNNFGQLGIGTSGVGNYTNVPVRVKDTTGTGYLTNVSHISASKHKYEGINDLGRPFNLARQNDGTILAWGDNEFGHLGVDTNTYPRSTLPIEVDFTP